MSLMLFIAMIIVVFLCFTVPVFFWGRFGYRTKGFFASVVIGAAVYVVYHLIIRTTALSLTVAMDGILSALVNAVFYALGITAMNFIAYKMCKMTARDERCCFAIGIGEALAESALVVGMAYINNIFYSVLILDGSFNTYMMSAGFDPATIAMVESTLVNFPVSSLFLSGFERMLFSSALILAVSGFAGYYDQDKKINAVLISSLTLFLAYFIPSLLSNVSDGSLVYVSMCFMALVSVFVSGMLSRRGIRLFKKES